MSGRRKGNKGTRSHGGHGLKCPVCSTPPVKIERTPEGRRVCPRGHVWRMKAGQAVLSK